MFNFFKKKPAIPDKLFYSTDLHSHIIPGIDDGSPTPDTSALLLQRMMSWGITRVIATPHVTESTFENTPATMDAALDKLNAVLEARNITIDLTHSAEYRIDDLFKRQLDAGEIVPLPRFQQRNRQ